MILLDEIEKAHPDVFNILLQVLDEGHLTDNYGRVIDFKNTVVIMTSNVGRARHHEGQGAGIRRAGDVQSNFDRIAERVREELKNVFNPGVPEPAGRRDRVPPAGPHAYRADRPGDAEGRAEAAERGGADAQASPTRRTDFLVKHGYDESYGARPLKRAIQRYIEDPLSEKILLGEFSRGEELEVDVAPDGTKLDFRVLTGTTKA